MSSGYLLGEFDCFVAGVGFYDRPILVPEMEKF